MDSKIINFPVPETYQWAIIDSNKRTEALIEMLNIWFRSRKKLEKEWIESLLAEANLDIYRDFIPSDLAIINFHLRYYYELDFQF